MAKATQSDTAVVIDDEPYNISWIVDFLEDLGLKVIPVSDVNKAIGIIEKEIFRFLLIDLSIPVFEPFQAALTDRGGAYARFPGLFIAERARNRGYRDRQVVIYSVHKDPEVAAEAKKLGCTYILKGRPREIKQEIQAVLSFDPTAE